MKKMLSAEKKPVLVRLPQSTFEELLTLAATETLIRRESISIPKLIVEMLQKSLMQRSPKSSSGKISGTDRKF